MPAVAACCMAAEAACSLVRGGMVTRSVRSPLTVIAVSRPPGMVSNQPIFTTRLSGGLPIDSRLGLLESHSAVPSMTRMMRPWRSAKARISPGSSAAGW